MMIYIICILAGAAAGGAAGYLIGISAAMKAISVFMESEELNVKRN